MAWLLSDIVRACGFLIMLSISGSLPGVMAISTLSD